MVLYFSFRSFHITFSFLFFLLGECTDLKVAAAFTKDVKEVGYGTMRINNYRKNGELFSATVMAFPVYDTVESTGPEVENPVLTHFATILTHVQTLKHEDVEPIIPASISKCTFSSSGKSVPFDRRQNCRQYAIEYALTPDRYVFMFPYVCMLCMFVFLYLHH